MIGYKRFVKSQGLENSGLTGGITPDIQWRSGIARLACIKVACFFFVVVLGGNCGLVAAPAWSRDISPRHSFPRFIPGRAKGWDAFSRSILVIYAGSRKETDDDNNFRKYWEFPLNYLGIKARYWNIRKGFPEPSALGQYRAVAFQFDKSSLPHVHAFWRFVGVLLDRHIKVLFLESFPENDGSGDGRTAGLRESVLRRMGLGMAGVWDTNAFGLGYGIKDLWMEGFEYPLPKFPSEFRPLVNLSPHNHVYLSVNSNDARNQGLGSVYALSGPWGGLVFDPFMIRWPVLDSRHTLWYVDPFRFLEKVLGVRNSPRMDLTTLNGMRVFYSQVDGDAFDTLSIYKRRQMSAEVLYHEIFTRMDLPFTVSVITSQIDPRYQGSRNRVVWARKIFALSNVEAGSHTFSHPFYWVPTKKQRNEGPIHIEIPHYTFDLKREIGGSIDWINKNLLPPHKKVRLLQWSGDTRPGKAAMAELATTHVLNINGSDTRFDDNAPSYTFVFPYFRRIGQYVQYYNSDVNDYILTNDWGGPYFGYLNVIETFRHTDLPKRVDPIDVYFHFYAGQRESSLNALKQVLAWVQKQPVAPLFASQFVRMEQGYIGARISKRKDDAGTYWEISGYGKDTTVRFDHAASLFPVVSTGTGVIGYRHRKDSLYVYLSPDRNRATIRLDDHPPTGPWLSRSTGYVYPSGTISRKSIQFVYDGWEARDRVVWKGLAPSSRFVLWESPNPDVPDEKKMILMTDPEGGLAIGNLKDGATYRLLPANQ